MRLQPDCPGRRLRSRGDGQQEINHVPFEFACQHRDACRRYARTRRLRRRVQGIAGEDGERRDLVGSAPGHKSAAVGRKTLSRYQKDGACEEVIEAIEDIVEKRKEARERQMERERFSNATPVTDMSGLVRVDDIKGKDVHNPKGDEIGVVEAVAIDADKGSIAYVVMSHGGFLGIGEKLVAVPWREFRMTRDGDLGERMRAAFIHAFAGGVQTAVLIGSDIPDISVDLLQQAFTALVTHEVVIGPSEDGGYYLIGLVVEHAAQLLPLLFYNMGWSSKDLFAVTQERLDKAGYGAAVLPTLRDIDLPADLFLARDRGLL